MRIEAIEDVLPHPVHELRRRGLHQEGEGRDELALVARLDRPLDEAPRLHLRDLVRAEAQIPEEGLRVGELLRRGLRDREGQGERERCTGHRPARTARSVRHARHRYLLRGVRGPELQSVIHGVAAGSASVGITGPPL